MPAAAATVPVIYIAGPFRGADAWQIEQNVREAEGYGHMVANAGAMPLIPHANTRFFHGTQTERFWLEGTLELLRRCDGLLLSPKWVVSTGSRGEKAEAEKLGLPIFEALYDPASSPTFPVAWLRHMKGPPVGSGLDVQVYRVFENVWKQLKHTWHSGSEQNPKDK